MLTNNGTMNLEAIAHAHATSANGSAYAYASVDTGIYQYVDATTGATSASAAISNTGALNIESIAGAVGAKTAEAYASMSTGIYQEAYYGKATSVSLNNSSTGTLNIEALANASGNKYVYAEASISNTGIYQYAYASNVAGATSNAALTNAGTLNIVAQATGVGLAGATDVYAYAYIDSTESTRKRIMPRRLGSLSTTLGRSTSRRWRMLTRATTPMAMLTSTTASISPPTRLAPN